MQSIRNIAIIAHVDHGKTTLVDKIIDQAKILDDRKIRTELLLDPCVACFRRLLQVGVGRIVQGDRQSACLEEREMDACQKMARALEIEWVVYGIDGFQRLGRNGFSEQSPLP